MSVPKSVSEEETNRCRSHRQQPYKTAERIDCCRIHPAVVSPYESDDRAKCDSRNIHTTLNTGSVYGGRGSVRCRVAFPALQQYRMTECRSNGGGSPSRVTLRPLHCNHHGATCTTSGCRNALDFDG